MALRIPKPEHLQWYPLQHRCGCVIDWGIEASKTAVIQKLFPQIAPELCPVHTEGTITPQPLVAGEIRVRAPELLLRFGPNDTAGLQLG